jgi:hypothetical protein
MRNYPRDLSKQPLTAEEQAHVWRTAQATSIRPDLLIACIIRGDLYVLTEQQQDALMAYIDRHTLNIRARRVFDRVMGDAGMLIAQILGPKSSDHNTPGSGPEQSPTEGGSTSPE